MRKERNDEIEGQIGVGGKRTERGGVRRRGIKIKEKNRIEKKKMEAKKEAKNFLALIYYTLILSSSFSLCTILSLCLSITKFLSSSVLYSFSTSLLKKKKRKCSFSPKKREFEHKEKSPSES